MTLPISYFRFFFSEYVLKTRLPPNCATGFIDRLWGCTDISISTPPFLIFTVCGDGQKSKDSV